MEPHTEWSKNIEYGYTSFGASHEALLHKVPLIKEVSHNFE